MGACTICGKHHGQLPRNAPLRTRSIGWLNTKLALAQRDWANAKTLAEIRAAERQDARIRAELERRGITPGHHTTTDHDEVKREADSFMHRSIL